MKCSFVTFPFPEEGREPLSQMQAVRSARSARAFVAEGDTREALLEAAFQSAVRFGWQRVRMNDVAARAGVSRQTLYRHFQTKEGLAQALALREQDVFLEGFRQAFDTHADLYEAVAASVSWSLKHAESHPLISQAIEDYESGLLPYITTLAAPLMTRSRQLGSELLVALDPTIDPETVALLCDVITREMFSHTITPSEPVDVVAARLGTLAVRVVDGGKEHTP